MAQSSRNVQSFQNFELPGFVQDGIGRVERATRQARQQARRVGRQVGKRVRQGRRDLEKQVRQLRKGAASGLRRGMQSVVDPLPVATKRDLARVDRKVAQLRKQVAQLEKKKKGRAA